MPANNTVTVTGKIGPGLEVSSLVLNNVSDVNFDFIGQTVEVVVPLGTRVFQLSDITAVTFTIDEAGGPVEVAITNAE